MKLERYIKQYQELNNIVDILDDKIQGYNQYKDAMGLIPDEIQFSPEFVELKKQFNIAFKTLQNFNKSTRKEAKAFRKEYGNYTSIMSLKV